MTSNTVEDFRKTRDLIFSISPEILFVITSDFHIERAKLLANILHKYSRTVFVPAKSSLAKSELHALIAHERKAIENIAANNYEIY